MVILENNWRKKRLIDLEKDYLIQSLNKSRLTMRINELRQIPLDTYTTEDLRIMIGQSIGLDYLIPLALETLKVDLFAEGDFFEGDLLKSILSIETAFWNNNKEYWLQLNNLIKDRKIEVVAAKFDTSKFDNSKHRL